MLGQVGSAWRALVASWLPVQYTEDEEEDEDEEEEEEDEEDEEDEEEAKRRRRELPRAGLKGGVPLKLRDFVASVGRAWPGIYCLSRYQHALSYVPVFLDLNFNVILRRGEQYLPVHTRRATGVGQA